MNEDNVKKMENIFKKSKIFSKEELEYKKSNILNENDEKKENKITKRYI